MITLDDINQKLNPRGYHILPLVTPEFNADDVIDLVKCSNIFKPLADLPLDCFVHSYAKCYAYLNRNYIPDDIALLFKHFIESVFKNGLDKSFNHHIDFDSFPDAMSLSNDHKYYYHHDVYVHKYYEHFIKKSLISSMDFDIPRIAKDLQKCSKHHVHLSKKQLQSLATLSHQLQSYLKCE